MTTALAPSKRLTVRDIAAMKGKRKIVALTAYSAPIARLIDAHVDIALVGDSLGMTIYGAADTLGVALEQMIAHGKAVAQATQHACTVIDLPFGSYQESPAQAFQNSARVLRETGAQAVKLEGAEEMAETVAFLSARGIPVMAHIGLMPQHVHMMGGYRYQGRSDEDKKRLIESARALEAAGAFSMVLEGMREDIAAEISGLVKIPTIGIGASPTCDGQVLVIDDVLGMTERPPKFAKAYAQMNTAISAAVEAYASEVREGVFPGAEHCFFPK